MQLLSCGTTESLEAHKIEISKSGRRTLGAPLVTFKTARWRCRAILPLSYGISVAYHKLSGHVDSSLFQLNEIDKH